MEKVQKCEVQEQRKIIVLKQNKTHAKSFDFLALGALYFDRDTDRD
jgi:hypothetical protein